MTLSTSVQRIFEALSQLRRTGVVQSEPIKLGHITGALGAMGLHAPQDLVTLYSVSDGTRDRPDATIGEISIMPGYYWLALNDAVETYTAVNAAEQWDASWFPVLASGGGDFYAVICNPASPDNGAVVGFILGEASQIVEFESLDTLFATIAASYEKSAFYVTDGHLVADYPRMRALARELQPNFTEHDA